MRLTYRMMSSSRRRVIVIGEYRTWATLAISILSCRLCTWLRSSEFSYTISQKMENCLQATLKYIHWATFLRNSRIRSLICSCPFARISFGHSYVSRIGPHSNSRTLHSSREHIFKSSRQSWTSRTWKELRSCWFKKWSGPSVVWTVKDRS